jgi:translation elongation factor P/translation initiation factor 5A
VIDPATRKLRLLGEERSPGIFSCARIFIASLFGDPMIVASQLRMALRIDKQIYKVLEAEFKAGAGQAGGMVKTKLRNASGRMWEPHFRPDERLEDLELERQTVEFLYRDASNCVFMNPDNYEQEEIPPLS